MTIPTLKIKLIIRLAMVLAMSFIMPLIVAVRLRRQQVLQTLGLGTVVGALGIILVVLVGGAVVVGAAEQTNMAMAANCTAQDWAEIEAVYNNHRSFQADFVQQDTNADGEQTTAEGSLAYQNGKMRWTYTNPDPQLIISNGTYVWLYDPLLDNVLEHKLADVARSTVLYFLNDLDDLQHSFSCTKDSENNANNSKAVLLRFKNSPDEPPLRFSYNPKRNLIIGIDILNEDNSVRSFGFTAKADVATFPKDFFEYEVDHNTETIR